MRGNKTNIEEVTRLFGDLGLLTVEEAHQIQSMWAKDASRKILQILQEQGVIDSGDAVSLREELDAWASGRVSWSRKMEINTRVCDLVSSSCSRRRGIAQDSIKETKRRTSGTWAAVKVPDTNQ